MGLARRISCLAFAIAILFLSAPLRCESGPWDDAASELAGQIAAHLGRNASITFEMQNRSALGADEIAEAARALRAQLRSRGVRVLVTKHPVPKVVVTLTDNARGVLWIAQIQRGDAQDVVMAQALKPQAYPTPGPEALVLRSTPVFEQAIPILDLAQISPPGATEPMLLVLDTEKVALYSKQESGWVIQQSLPLARSNPWPRDPRGRLVVREAGAFEAFTPGSKCQGTLTPSLMLDCTASDAGWPVGSDDSTAAHFVTERNYFDGKMTTSGQQNQAPEFFTTASVPAEPAQFRIYANLDGRARMFGKGPQPVAVFDGWGSDIVTVRSGCRDGFQILATSSGSLSQADSIRAFSIRGREAVPASAPVEFRGPITALWPTPDGAAALAVQRNLATGMYDAFSVSISGGR
jgi:hypothetical protein